MKILLLFSVLLITVTTTKAQCPTSSLVTSAQKCLRISYPTPPSPLPAYLIYNGIQYNYSAGAGTNASPAEYIDPNSNGACSSYNNANASITLPSGQVCNYVGGVLPISFLLFTANINSLNQAIIQWKINEINVVKYEIEKSTDGINFSSIGTVHSNGNGENNYQFTDLSVDKTIQYYRIKKYMADNSTHLSSIQKVTLANNAAITIYPNPVKNSFTINSSDKNLLNSAFYLVDMEGKLIKSFTLKYSGQQFDIITKNGLYYLKMGNGKFVKLVIAN